MDLEVFGGFVEGVGGFWRFFGGFLIFLEVFWSFLEVFFRFLIVLISVTELAVTGIAAALILMVTAKIIGEIATTIPAFCCFTNDFRTMMMPHTSLLVSPSQLIFGSASASTKITTNTALLSMMPMIMTMMTVRIIGELAGYYYHY